MKGILDAMDARPDEFHAGYERDLLRSWIHKARARGRVVVPPHYDPVNWCNCDHGGWDLGKSARVLGWEFRKTAQEMNALLKEHGYLYGEPGAYGLTEKGEQFGADHYHENGYGGYAHRNWETRTWNDDLAGALRADMEAAPLEPTEVLAADVAPAVLEVDEPDGSGYVVTYDDNGDALPDVQTKHLVAGLAVLVAGVLIWRYGPPLWNNHIKPKSKKAWDKLSKRGPLNDEEPEGSEPTE